MIVDREEQGETLSRLLPGGLAEKLRLEGKHIGESEELEVTVLMSDIGWLLVCCGTSSRSPLVR